MRKEVLNTTPLIVLCNIGYLYLLRELYGEVMIPRAVFEEISIKHDFVYRQVADNLDWIRVERVRVREDRSMYRTGLHDGEVEVMLLAQDEEADLVILDDSPATRMALRLVLKNAGE